LKKAQREFKNRCYDTALSTLEKAFNVTSLKNYFDPNWYKRKMAEALKTAMSKKSEGDKKEEGLAETTKTEKKVTADAIEELREKTEDKQKGMLHEDFEKKKLKPVLEEAYKLVCAIEEKTQSKDLVTAKLNKQKEKLEERITKLKSMETVEDMQENTKLLFKSIMCPLGAQCPKDNRQRWPASSTKTVTPFGRNCLYAHHYHELEFPETLNSKIEAIENMKVTAQKKAAAENFMPFRPAALLKDCAGCNNCNSCKAKHDNDKKEKEAHENKKKYLATMKKAEDPETTKYIDEMRDVKKSMNLDDNYFKKFGLLKKATVLLYYERVNEAMDEIAKAVQIAKEQRKHN
jgi:hypothetical protein